MLPCDSCVLSLQQHVARAIASGLRQEFTECTGTLTHMHMHDSGGVQIEFRYQAISSDAKCNVTLGRWLGPWLSKVL